MISLRTLWLFAFAFAATSGLRADPELTIATPPQQAALWSLPEGMDDPDGKIKTAVDTLFGLGLADPRGCSYRHVTIKEGGVQVEARGWVLPESKNVIGWNGLIYQVEGVGGEADLTADLEILKRKGEFAEAPSSNYQDESIERILKQFAATPGMMRAWAAPYLLLRLGFPIGNAEVSDNPFDQTPFDFGKGGKLTFPKEWYFDSDNLWLIQFGFLVRSDGIAAFVDSNDRLAAARLAIFDRVWTEVEKRLPRVYGEPDNTDDDPFNDPPGRPRLNPVWRSVLADAKRRIAPGVVPEQSEIEWNIAQWDRLETWDEENTPEFFNKVVAAGPAAINPLLDLLKQAYFRARKQADDQLANGLPEVTMSSIVCAQNEVRRVGTNSFMRLVEEWKPGNVDLLKSHYNWLEAGVVKLRKAEGYGDVWISGFCEEALIRRFWAKDESAMRDYEKFFRASLEFNEVPLDVMKELTNEPGMDQLAREAFLGDKAPLRFTKPWTSSEYNRKNLIETYRERSPLLELPAFRQALVEALRGTTKQATLTLTKDGGTLKYDAGKPGEIDSVSKGAALLCTAAVGTEIEVRLCDLIVYYLTPKYGLDVWVSPVFHLDDPLPARDRAISEWIHMLDR